MRASTLYEASRCRTPEGSLLKRIIGAAKVYDNIYMKRGRELEELIINAITKKMNLSIKKYGLLLIQYSPVLGASPDGLGSDFVLEVKFPSSKKTVKNYTRKEQLVAKC